MKVSRRRLLQRAAGAVVIVSMRGSAWAQGYPTRSVRLISGFPAGGPNDFVARVIGQWLSQRLGQPFVIENRPGAGSNIATEEVVRAAPDGYTLLMVATPNAINATLYQRLKFNFIRDIAPIAGIARVPNIMVVHPSVPAETVPAFIAYAKANPGKVIMASPGIGSAGHLSGELFRVLAGVEFVHVPYRGAAPAMTDLLGGRVQLFFGPLPTMIGYVKSGTLRALALTGAARAQILPDIPTVGEFVPGYEVSTWFGVGAPKGTPAEIIDTLNREINLALRDRDVQQRLADQGGTLMPGTPADFARLIAAETEKWGEVVQSASLKAD